MSVPVLILGAGGHGRVLAESLRLSGRTILGFLDTAGSLKGGYVGGLPVLGGDSYLEHYETQAVMLANGIGSIESTNTRRQLYERMRGAGFQFETIRHPATTVAVSVELGDGVQIMAGVILQPNVAIGENTILNTGTIIDHDCRIGAHCHLAPGVVFSGEIRVGNGVHIGTGVRVIQGITIGDGAMVAAGAVVVRNVPAGAKMAGVPARPMEKR